MKKKLVLTILIFAKVLCFGQTDLEEYFDLCLEFGAPVDVVELFQPFRAYKAELNGTISYVTQEDVSLLRGRNYSEYQIWYTVDEVLGLYQTTLIVRGESADLQHIFTSYLRKFDDSFDKDPVYTHLDNGSVLVFWYDQLSYVVEARLILDIHNEYKFVSITYCSPFERHKDLLITLYNGTPDDDVHSIGPPVLVDATESAAH